MSHNTNLSDHKCVTTTKYGEKETNTGYGTIFSLNTGFSGDKSIAATNFHCTEATNFGENERGYTNIFPTASASHVISVSQPRAPTLQKAQPLMSRTEEASPSFPTTPDLQVMIVPQPQTPTVQSEQAVVKTQQIFVPTNSKGPQPIVNQVIFTQYQEPNNDLKQFEKQRLPIQHQQPRFSQLSQQQRWSKQQLFQLQQQQQHQPRFSAPQNLSSLKPIPLHKIVQLHHHQKVETIQQQQLAGLRQQLKTAEAGGEKLAGTKRLLQIALEDPDVHFRALESQAKRHNTGLECQQNMPVVGIREQIVPKLPPTGEVMGRAEIPNQGNSKPERPSETMMAENLTTLTKEEITKPAASEQQQRPSQFNPEKELKTADKELKQTRLKSVKRKSEVTREESPKNKSPKEATKKKWKLAPDSQQKEGITTRLRYQKDNQTKKVSPPRTPYTRKLRSAQAQLKEEETKEKRTYDAFWNENDEVIKEILSDSDSSDTNDS